MTLTIREMGPPDHPVWASMAHALWPDVTIGDLLEEITLMAGAAVGGRRGWLAERAGVPVGFAELGLRPYANGCEGQPVDFLEGIWVDPAAQREGVASELIRHLCAVVRAEGRSELGSDARLENLASHAAHRAWGFTETQRVIYFRMDLS